jgi:hypothetical protein
MNHPVISANDRTRGMLTYNLLVIMKRFGISTVPPNHQLRIYPQAPCGLAPANS